MDSLVKLVVYVPESHAETVRRAIANAGGGHVGNYDYCSFTVKGVGRFRPLDGAHPTIGQVGKVEEVVEERIEVGCFEKDLEKIISAIKKVHPYEAIALDVYPTLPVSIKLY